MPRRERPILNSLKRSEALRRTNRRKRIPIQEDPTQPSVMQKGIDVFASVAGLVGICGGSLLVAMDNPTGWIAITSGAIMDAAALSQIIKAESSPHRSQTFRSSRLSYADAGAVRTYAQPGLPMPDAYAVPRFMEEHFLSPDNSES